MLSRVNAPKDILAGVIFIVFGLATFFKARDYQIGSALDMGPGYFPAAVGLLLAFLGCAGILRGLLQKTADPITPHRLGPLVLIFVGIMVFSFLIETAGLVIASAALIAITCAQRIREHPVEVLATYVLLTAFVAFVFIYLFEMQLRLFWWQ